jgi:hypothetical protein
VAHQSDTDDSAVLHFIVPGDMLEAIDALVREAKERAPHRTVSRSDIARELMDLALREKGRKR